MNGGLLLIGSVVLICILLNRVLEKIPVPALLIFLLLGMCFGENGLLRISFDDYVSVNLICSVSLIFIMFYGGFGTNLQAARPVVAQAATLSTLGVAGTAGGREMWGLDPQEDQLRDGVIADPDGYPAFYRQLVAAVRGEEPVPVDPADAVAVLEIIGRAFALTR